MANDYTIRPATLDDTEAIASIWAVMAAEHRHYDPQAWNWAPDARDIWARDHVRHMARENMATLVAVDAGGGVVGFAKGTVDCDPVLFVEGRKSSLWDLAVLPDHRRKGLGRRLMEAICKAFADMGAEDMVLHVAGANPGAIRLYEQLGMRSVATRMYMRL